MSETIPGAPPAAAAAHDLTLSKLLRPLVRPGTVARSPLIERLANGDAQRIVSVVAPPGYGKTTLLSQWAERSGQAFSWVSVAEPDNDPKILLTYVAAALDAVEPIGGRVFDALAALFFALTGRPVEAERWADVVDRWQYGEPAPGGAPHAEAHAAILRALMCRGGLERMRADADEAVRMCAAQGIVSPAPALYLGLAHLLTQPGGLPLPGADAARR